MRNSGGAMRLAELAILNAPFDDGGWQRAVAATAAATSSSGAQLLGLGGPMLLPLSVFVGNFAGYERYFTDPALHGPGNWRVGTTTVPMAIQHEGDYDAYRNIHGRGDYEDAISDLDIPFGCQSALLLDRNQLLGLALLRRHRDGRCDSETLQRFAHLRQQFSRSVRVQLALDGEAAELMLGDTDRLHGATLLLDRHGALAALTPAAEEALGEGGPLNLSGLAVHLRQEAADPVFQRALAFVLGSDWEQSPAVHQMRVGEAGRRWELCMMRLPHRQHGLGFDPHVAIALKRRA